jgi:hypothetical protein
MRRSLIFYLIGVVLLSSVDVSYVWLDPLEGTESATPIQWYSMVGLRNGAMFLGNHESAIEGFSFKAHVPVIFPIPVYAGVGPEGGGIFLTVWFIALLLWVTRSLLRRIVHSLLGVTFKFGTNGS